jgi:hypothetical protein
MKGWGEVSLNRNKGKEGRFGQKGKDEGMFIFFRNGR